MPLATIEDLQPFALLLEAGQYAALIRNSVDCETNRQNAKVSVKLGSKYARVDIGNSGRYMVNRLTREIVGVKAYGVPHLGHRFGTLDTIHEYDWSGYRAARLPGQSQAAPVAAPAAVTVVPPSVPFDSDKFRLDTWNGNTWIVSSGWLSKDDCFAELLEASDAGRMCRIVEAAQ